MKLIFFHFVGIFIFYKMKKKFNSITFFFMEIYSVFFIEMGNFDTFIEKYTHRNLPNYPRDFIWCSFERRDKIL